MPTPAPITLDVLARRVLDAIAAAVDEDPITDEQWNDTDPEAVEQLAALRNAIHDTLTAWLTHEFTVDTIAQVLANDAQSFDVFDTPSTVARAFRIAARNMAAALVATLTAQVQAPADARPQPQNLLVDQALLNLVGRMRARHCCEPGGDNDAWELARRTQDLIGAVDKIGKQRDEALGFLAETRRHCVSLGDQLARAEAAVDGLRADLAQAEVDAKAGRVEIQRLGDQLAQADPEPTSACICNPVHRDNDPICQHRPEPKPAAVRVVIPTNTASGGPITEPMGQVHIAPAYDANVRSAISEHLRGQQARQQGQRG